MITGKKVEEFLRLTNNVIKKNSRRRMSIANTAVTSLLYVKHHWPCSKNKNSHKHDNERRPEGPGTAPVEDRKSIEILLNGFTSL